MGFLDKVKSFLGKEGADIGEALNKTKDRLNTDLDKRERDLNASPEEKLDAMTAELEDNDPLAEVRNKIDGQSANADANAELAQDGAEPADSAETASAPAAAQTSAKPITAVLFDFGGVVTTSPFDAFAKFEKEQGLPADIIRKINSTNPDTNAWALFERNQVDRDRFIELFGLEAQALGHEIDGGAVLDLLKGSIRPEMVDAIKACKSKGLKVACLTNNISSGEAGAGAQEMGEFAEAMGLFDEIIESSKIGVRKPEMRFYQLACEQVGVEPDECVFLDDLGINLRPARSMGMTTIKVVESREAIAALWEAIDD